MINISVTVTGIREAATRLDQIGEAARWFQDNPRDIGPTVDYGVYQEARRHYMQAGADRVAPAVPGVIQAGLIGGPALMRVGVEKLARDVQATSATNAPVKTGALRGSIGVFPGGTGSSRGGTPSRRMKNAAGG